MEAASILMGHLFDPGIRPKLFEVVELTGFPVKDVNDDIGIIEEHPFRIFLAFDLPRFFVEFFPGLLFDRSGDSFHLCVGVAVTDDEEVTDGVREFAKVDPHDPFRFPLLHSSDHRIGYIR